MSSMACMTTIKTDYPCSILTNHKIWCALLWRWLNACTTTIKTGYACSTPPGISVRTPFCNNQGLSCLHDTHEDGLDACSALPDHIDSVVDTTNEPINCRETIGSCYLYLPELMLGGASICSWYLVELSCLVSKDRRQALVILGLTGEFGYIYDIFGD